MQHPMAVQLTSGRIPSKPSGEVGEAWQVAIEVYSNLCLDQFVVAFFWMGPVLLFCWFKFFGGG